jgi:nitrite reductase/ring-hydroxylating ferredoxin subunit
MMEALIRVSRARRTERSRWTSSGEVLVMLPNGKPRVVANVCMHHGRPLTLDGDTLTCQWQGVQYDARSGPAMSGPPRREARLIVLPTRTEDGVLDYVYDDTESEDPQHNRDAVIQERRGQFDGPVVNDRSS